MKQNQDIRDEGKDKKNRRNLLRNTFYAFTIPHVGIQIANGLNHLSHEIAPSKIRRDFEMRHNVQLIGPKHTVEDEQERIVELSSILDKERLDRGFSLYAIQMRSPHYWRQDIHDQLTYLLGRRDDGYYACNSVSYAQDCSAGTLHHEIKHKKAYDILDRDSYFLEGWNEHARSENGESLYYTPLQFACSYVSYLEGFVPERLNNSQENARLGFITNYARSHIHEDIAVLCEFAEKNPEIFIPLLYSSNPNEAVKGKVEIAQETKLVPRGFSDYIYLLDSRKKIFGTKGYVSKETLKDYLSKSGTFLMNHKGSTYSGEEYILQGKIFEHERYEGTANNSAANAYKNALVSGYLRHEFAQETLSSLERLHREKLQRPREAQIFSDALARYKMLKSEGDLTLPTEGVNEYIRTRGVYLPLRPSLQRST